MTSPSGSVAAVVVTSRIRWGCSASHPSVKCTLYPTHPVFSSYYTLPLHHRGIKSAGLMEEVLDLFSTVSLARSHDIVVARPPQDIYSWYFL